MLEDIAKEIRKDIMTAAYHGKSGHLASAFSAVEIMTALYFGDILRYDKDDPNWSGRDKLIVSKGHGSLVLYSVLKKIGYITQEELYTFCQPGSVLGGEPKYGDIPGVEATTGSLGHGLSFAVGVALANKLDQKKSRVYKLLCLLSKNVGKVLTHTFITQNIWGRSWENDVASLRVFMATLRKKLEPKPDSPQYIQTHIGVGYRMMKVE